MATFLRAPVKRLKLRSRGGCVPCKLRKRKCDESRPACGYCQRLGYECRWLDELSVQEYHQASTQVQQRQRRKFEVDFPSQHDGLIIRHDAQSIAPCRIADRQDVRISFLLHMMFKGANTAIQTGAAGSSLTVHTELQFANDDTSLTYDCLAAMALMYWGATQNDKKLLVAGYDARGRGLARLRSALMTRVDAGSGDLVAAVALMRLSDTIMPGASSQWIIHAEALSNLFRVIGPEGFRAPRMRRLVENNRWVMIMASSWQRQPTLLNKDEWKTIPWENAPKDMLQKLLDIYARLPTLHSLFDDGFLPTADPIKQLKKRAQFNAELQDTLDELRQWRDSVDEEISHSVNVCDIATTPIQPLDPNRPCLSFTQLHHGYSVGLFNTIIIVLGQYLSVTSGRHYTIETSAQPESSQTLLHPLELPIENPLQRAAMAADEIAQIFPWAMQDSHQGAGGLYMAGPGVVCEVFFRRFDPHKALWFSAALSHIGSSWKSLLLHAMNTD